MVRQDKEIQSIQVGKIPPGTNKGVQQDPRLQKQHTKEVIQNAAESNKKMKKR